MRCASALAICTKLSRWRSKDRNAHTSCAGRNEACSKPTECRYCSHWQSHTSVFPARHVLHVMSINQTHLETVLFQDLKQRDPENSGRFHRDRFHAAFSEPLGNFVQIFRECLIAPHRLWIPVPRHRNIYTRCSDVDARGIVLLDPLGMLRLCLRLALSCHAPSPLSESSGAARVVQETSTLLNGIAAQRHHCLAHRTWSHAVKRVQRTPCDSRLLACLPDDSHQCRKSRPPRFWISSVPYLIARRTAQ